MTSLRIYLTILLFSLCSVGIPAQSPIFFPGVDPSVGSDVEEPDVDFEREVNSLRDISDFAKFFQFELPAQDPFERNVSLISTRTGAGGGFSFDAPTSVTDLPHAGCTPEMTSVPLDLPNIDGVTFFPTCVRVERCGGCCFTSQYSCQPTAVHKMRVKVIRVQEEVVKPRRRRVRNAEPNYIDVEVERHIACGCDCKFQASECNNAIHEFNRDYCQCVCKDRIKEEDCLNKRSHFWNSAECECLCRNPHACSSGQVFDHTTCSCVQEG